MKLEQLAQSDYGRVAEWLSDPGINRWLAGRWHDRVFDERHVSMIAAPPSTRLFLIREEDEPAGLVALSEIDLAERSASIWFFLDPGHRSRGLASAGVLAAGRIAFEDLNLVSLRAWVTEGNNPSRRLLERIGFKSAGLLRRGSLLDGCFVDRWLFDILSDEFTASAGSKENP